MITLPKKNQCRWSTFLSMNSIWGHLGLKVLIGVPWGAYFGWYDAHTAMRCADADAPFNDWRRHPDESK